jgi:hypothetical protein
MIARIATEGQYELTESDAEVLEDLDNKAIEACQSGDERQFQAVFHELLEFVRNRGEPVPGDRLAASDIILPPPDATLEEARSEFSGEGLIPG